MTEVFVLFWGINLFTLILSGAIFPLDIFGGDMLRFFDVLPFKYTTYFPTNILTGRLDGNLIIFGIIIQFIWIIILLIMSNFLWKLGMKKYVAVGG